MYIQPLESFINLLTDEACVICNKHKGPICEICFNELSEESEIRCYICNKLTKQNKVCTNCKSRLRRVWWASIYDSELKQLIKLIKLSRKRAIARSCGNYLSTILPYLDPDTIIVPVPTAPKRIRRRGFDQAVLMAKHLAKSKKLRYQHILVRANNSDQIGKRRVERIKQMQNSFKLKQNVDIKGKSILLVDDVLTTGATLESAATVLRSNGASHVDAVVLARHLLK